MTVRAKSVNREHQEQRGQSMVEIALTLPFLIILVIVLVEMGIIFATYISMINAAREGAVFASMYPGLVDPGCGSSPNPSCTGANDGNPYGPDPSSTVTLWNEYQTRVRNEVFTAVTEQLRAGQLIDSSAPPIVDRPIIGSTSAGCPTGIEAGCPITITVHYNLHTFTSDISLPTFGRFGLPSTYQLNYSMGIPVR